MLSKISNITLPTINVENIGNNLMILLNLGSYIGLNKLKIVFKNFYTNALNNANILVVKTNEILYYLVTKL